MFSSRKEWFEHELKKHRREWLCEFCDTKAFEDAHGFEAHMSMRHPGDVAHSSMQALLDQSQAQIEKVSPSACTMCNDWESSLRQRARTRAQAKLPEGNLYGTLKQFRQHLGRHMEQLALFAIPRQPSNDQDNGERSDDERFSRSSTDGGNPIMSSRGEYRDSVEDSTLPSITLNQRGDNEILDMIRIANKLHCQIEQVGRHQ